VGKREAIDGRNGRFGQGGGNGGECHDENVLARERQRSRTKCVSWMGGFCLSGKLPCAAGFAP
jgi:hypothetical protein